jgi:hypothetical protein
MEFKKIKNKLHYLYTISEWEAKYPDRQICHWKVGTEGDWVLTDDGHVCQILKKAKYGRSEIVRTICGTYDINQKTEMLGEIPDNIYSFSKNTTYKNFKGRKEATSRELLFARYIAKGDDVVKAYLRAYKTDNAEYADRRSKQLIKTKRVQNMIDDAIQKILDEEGVTHNYIIKTYKQVSDLSDKDSDRLRALDSLAKISGLFEKEKQTEQLTVFAGFTDKQMEAIKGGKTKVIADAKRELPKASDGR